MSQGKIGNERDVIEVAKIGSRRDRMDRGKVGNRGKMGNRLAAAVLALVMVWTALPGFAWAAAVGGDAAGGNQDAQEGIQAMAEDGLLAYYDFAERPQDGKTVRNQAGGTVGDAVIENEGKAGWEDGALALSGEGTSNAPVGPWVSLPSELFAGKESATIIMEVCPTADIVTKNHFLWSIGNEKTDMYWFANTYSPRTSIKYGGREKTAQSSEKLEGGRWYSYAGVIDAQKKTISMYINGKKVGETSDGGMSLAQVAQQSRNTIGRAPYNDPLFSGKVAAFRAYGRALSEEEIT